MSIFLSNRLIKALFFNFIAIILAACASINSILILSINNQNLKIEGLVSVSILLILSYIINLISAYHYKHFFSKELKTLYISNLILTGTIITLIPVGEVLILIGWLLIAINLIMSK